MRPPQRGDLIRTIDGYHGIVLRTWPDASVEIYQGNGLRSVVPTTEYEFVTLPRNPECPASFAELIGLPR